MNRKHRAAPAQQGEKVGEVVVRKKMYKAGKRWVSTSLASVAVGVALFGASAAEAPEKVAASTAAKNESAVLKVGEPQRDQHVTLTATPAVASPTRTAAGADDTPTTVRSIAPTQAEQETRPADSLAPTQQATRDTAASPKTATANTTDLGTVDDDTFSVAKTQAAKEYAATGKAVTLSRVAADATGTIGTATYDLDDNGTLTIHSGEFSSGVYSLRLTNAITAIKIDEGARLAPGTEYGAIFGNLPNLTAIDAHNLDVSQALGFGGLFVNDAKLTSVNIAGWDTSNARTWANMFFGDTALKQVDLSGLDTSSATSMVSMFAGAGLETLDISNFDMSNVTDAKGMLAGLTDLWQLKLGPKVKLAGLATELPDAPVAGTQLPGGDDTNVTAEAKWQAVGGGTVLAPEGDAFTADALTAAYDGASAAPDETYVWAQNIQNTIHLLDPTSDQLISTSTVSGQFGTTIDLATALPIGYHYATAAELGTHAQPATPVTIGKRGTAFDVYVVADPTITINYVDDTDQSTVKTATVSGALNTTSGYTTDEDVAALEAKGYQYVSDDLPAALTFSTEPAAYTVHLTHQMQVIKGTDPTATAAQKKELELIIDGSSIGTTLSEAQVQPAGDLDQTLHYVRDTTIDEALKAKGATPAQYTSYGEWYTNDTLTDVVPAKVEGYTANLGTINMDTLVNSDDGSSFEPISKMLLGYVDQMPGNGRLTLHFAYKINKYDVMIQYIDKTVPKQVGELETLAGDYQSELVYPVVAPTGYDVVPGQANIVNNKIQLTFGPDMKVIQIMVTPQVTPQAATVTYQTSAGVVLATETLRGDSNTAIPFDTTAYATKNLSGYTISTDETAPGATFDTDTASNQNFGVTLVVKNVSTKLIPTGIDGNPLPGTTPTIITGQPGAAITALPTIPGYTLIPGQTPKMPRVDGAVTTIYYLIDPQHATIDFVDQNKAKLATLTTNGPSEAAIDHANIATVIQQIIKQGYNLTVDESVGATFDADASKNQAYTVTLSKLAAEQLPNTTQYVTINFVDQNNNSFGTLVATGEHNTAVDHHNVATVIQQILNQGYNLKLDETIGAMFDDDATKGQAFTVAFEKLPVRADTNVPGQPGEGDVPTGPDGGDTDVPSGPNGTDITVPSGPNGGDANIPNGPTGGATDVPSGPSREEINVPNGPTGATETPSVQDHGDTDGPDLPKTGTPVPSGTTNAQTPDRAFDGANTGAGEAVTALADEKDPATPVSTGREPAPLTEQASQSGKEATLPKTGDHVALPFSIVGLALLAALGSIGYTGKKRSEE